MAKGNLFLGTAARSVGDVVMYRREGAQVSRVRVRKIANPKTNAQSIQRNFFSPVAKFFAPLAITLAESFEGLSKSKSYSKFLKINIKKARSNGWYLPKGTGFFPLPYQVSEGTLPTMGYAYDANSSALTATIGTAATAVTTIGGLSAGFIAKGYAAGDIVTIIVAVRDANGNYFPLASQFVIDTDSADTIASSFGSITVAVSGESNNELSATSALGTVVGGAIIVARYENEKWRRSTQSFVVDADILVDVTDADNRATAIASYGNAANGANPLVYLDGPETVFQ